MHSSYVQVGDTALMRAALNGHTATVQYLVERTTAQVNVTNNVSHNVVVFTVALEVAIHVTAVTPVAVAYHVSLQSRKTGRVTNQ